MSTLFRSFLFIAAATLWQSASAVPVLPGGTGSVGVLTDLGEFEPGTYLLTGSGQVDLIGDNSFLVAPDGMPIGTVTTPAYPYFNPDGSYTADGQYGAAGMNAKIGALIGTLNPTPSDPSDWFLIGYSKIVTLGAKGHIYASVNDTYHENDTGGFFVTVTPVRSVPDSSATLGLMTASLGLLLVFARWRTET